MIGVSGNTICFGEKGVNFHPNLKSSIIISVIRIKPDSFLPIRFIFRRNTKVEVVAIRIAAGNIRFLNATLYFGIPLTIGEKSIGLLLLKTNIYAAYKPYPTSIKAGINRTLSENLFLRTRTSKPKAESILIPKVKRIIALCADAA